jgi:hypothetical protein
MKSTSMSIIAPVLFFASLTAAGQTTTISAPEQWEYKIIGCIPESELNKLGVQGWELVSVQSQGTSCYNYYLKRPKGYRINNTPPAPAPPPASTCNFSLAQAPVIHGIRLGMTTDELLAVFPRSKEQNEVRNALAIADIQYGRTSLYFGQSQYPDSKAFVNNLSHYNFDIFDGRVISILASYSFPSGIWNWNADNWLNKISEPMRLPSRENWLRINDALSIVCQGFSVRTNASGSEAWISIKATAPNPEDAIKERRNAEAEKRRREFTP